MKWNDRFYKQKRKYFVNHILWALLLEDGIVLNKDGSFLRTIEYRGYDNPDNDIGEYLNELFMSFSTGWAIFEESSKRYIAGYPVSSFSNPVALLIDTERRAYYEENGNRFLTKFYLTLLYRPPKDIRQKMGHIILRDKRNLEKKGWNDAINHFVEQTNRFYARFASAVSYSRVLTGSAALTYLHSTVSTRNVTLKMPPSTMFLDGLLVDQPLLGGFAPILGDSHLRVITLRYFPKNGVENLLYEVENLPYQMRIVRRFIALSKHEAVNIFRSYVRHWFQGRKSAGQVVTESIQGESGETNKAAYVRAEDANEVISETEQNVVAQGYMTVSIVLWDKNIDAVEVSVNKVIEVIGNNGFTAIYEKLNAKDAFLGTLPGHCYQNARKPVMNTMNFSHLISTTATWHGHETNSHLKGPALMLASTDGVHDFFVTLHQGENGNVKFAGPIRGGKTTLVNFSLCQFMRYEDAHVIQIDKGNGGLVTCYAMGGTHYNLSLDGGVRLQPLSGINTLSEQAWAKEWITNILERQNVVITTEIISEIFDTLKQLGEMKKSSRTITNFVKLVQHDEIRAALRPYTSGNVYGNLFDGNSDEIVQSKWLCFELEDIYDKQDIVEDALRFIFHRLYGLFNKPNGPPVVFSLDEGWRFIDKDMFRDLFQDTLKSQSKKNVSVWFTTQSNVDTTIDPVFHKNLHEQSATKIYLPNKNALSDDVYEDYVRLGLSDAEIVEISKRTPSKEYYYKCADGSRWFDLKLGSIALAICASGSLKDIDLAKKLYKKHPDNFASVFLREKGLDWAADALDDNVLINLIGNENNEEIETEVASII